MEQGSKDTTSAWFTRLHPLLLLAIIAGAALTIVGIIAAIITGYTYAETGFGSYTNPTGEVVRGKTFWDWLELLIIPVTLAVGGLLLNNAQRRREEEIAKQRTKEDRAIAERRIEEDRAIAKQRIEEDKKIAERNTQETTLETYLNQMGNLLIEKGLSSNPTPESKNVARVWTLTVVRRVNPERKGIVLRFLHEADLLYFPVTKGQVTAARRR